MLSRIAVLEAQCPGPSTAVAAGDVSVRQQRESTASVQRPEEALVEAASRQVHQEGGSAPGGVFPVASQAERMVPGELPITSGTLHEGYWPWGAWGQAIPLSPQVHLSPLGAGTPLMGSLGTTT